MKIAAITQGPMVPSTRFRWAQHAAQLQAEGFEILDLDAAHSAYPPKQKWLRPAWLAAALLDGVTRAVRSRSADLTLLQRNMVATLCTTEPLLRKPLVLDVDDAIFLGPRGSTANRIARQAALTICGNQYLAEYFAAYSPVALLPTAVDTAHFRPAAHPPSRPEIGWSGSSSGFGYLYAIEPALAQLLAKHHDLVLHIVADRAPSFTRLPADRLRFTPWSPAIEAEVLRGFTVGLMLLEDTPWARGKCSFKMLTYMASGLPVVVSPVGMNLEILNMGPCGLGAATLDDWVEMTTTVLRNPDLAADMGAQGRRIALQHFSRDVIGSRLAQLLRSVL